MAGDARYFVHVHLDDRPAWRVGPFATREDAEKAAHTIVAGHASDTRRCSASIEERALGG